MKQRTQAQPFEEWWVQHRIEQRQIEFEFLNDMAWDAECEQVREEPELGGWEF